MHEHLHLLPWLVALLVLSLVAYGTRDPRRLARARAALARLRRRRSPALTTTVAQLTPARHRPRPTPTVCAYPIVLVHGLMGFDALGPSGMRQEYFRGVRAHLSAQGQRVLTVRVSPLAGVQRRAEQLAGQIAALAEAKVNIVAHSMGGIDARYAISRLGLAERVASLTTIGTPHYGTPLADTGLIVRDLPGLPASPLANLARELTGFYDLTTTSMARFNAEVPNRPRVRYASYVGSVRGGLRDVHMLLAPSFKYLQRCAGDNDGIVPAVSQRWGAVLGEIQADHWAQIGWSRGLDVQAFYTAVARTLALWGL